MLMIFDKLRGLLKRDKVGAKPASEPVIGSGFRIPQIPVAQPHLEEGITAIKVKGRATTFLSALPPEEMAGGVDFITWLREEEKKSLPIVPPAAYLGVFVRRDKQRKPNIFLTNLAYLEFLHYSVAEIVPQLPDVIAHVKGQRTGTFYIFDGRFHDDQSVPSEDLPKEEIIGVFKIEDGGIAESSYLRNKKYKVWSQLGPAEVPVYLRAALVNKLAKMRFSQEHT